MTKSLSTLTHYYFEYQHTMPDPVGGFLVNHTRLWSLEEMRQVLVALDDYLLEHDPNLQGCTNLPQVQWIKDGRINVLADPNCPRDEKYLVNSELGNLIKYTGSPPPPVYVIPRKLHPLYP